MSLTNWENQTLQYDLVRYPWPDWVLSVIQEIEPQVEDLSRFHDAVPSERIMTVTNHVQQAFAREEFARRFDAFAEEYCQSLIDGKPYMIKRRPTLNVVVPDQHRLGRLLPFHQGVWYEDGRGQRTIWCALTPCHGSNSMWVVDSENSKRLSWQTVSQQWSQQQFEQQCLLVAKPVDIAPGQCHLFHQEIMHGNINNDTGVTRMSIDWDLLVQGQEHGRRYPGGFFRLPGDHRQSQNQVCNTDIQYVQYTGFNTDYASGIPTLYQRMAMDAYCVQRGLAVSAVQFENEYLTWMPILEKLIQDRVPGIIIPSIYCLPDRPQRRIALLQQALHSKVCIHFVNEYIVLENQDDLDLIETYRGFGVKKQGPYSWEF